MMKKLSIIKNGQEVQFANFDNDQAIEDFKAVLAKGEAWGLPERWVQDTPMSPLSEEDKAKAKDKRKVEVMGEEVEEYLFEAEYSIEVEDITAQVEAEKAAKGDKKAAKDKRKEDFGKLDWSKTMTVKQLQEVVKMLHDEVFGD